VFSMGTSIEYYKVQLHKRAKNSFETSVSLWTRECLIFLSNRATRCGNFLISHAQFMMKSIPTKTLWRIQEIFITQLMTEGSVAVDGEKLKTKFRSFE
jgi:hypothetical protein